jgi:hypothetical protein
MSKENDQRFDKCAVAARSIRSELLPESVIKQNLLQLPNIGIYQKSNKDCLSILDTEIIGVRIRT